MAGTAADAEASLSNTAHLPDLAVYTRNDLPSRKVLLIRDPVEIVLSRTLRKPAFRRYLGRETTDDARYLRENIVQVGRFYRKVEPEGYDLVVRYEDLRADPVPVLAAIARRLDTPADPARLLRAAARRRRDTGPEAAPEALREMARRALADVRRKFGYG